MKMLARGYVKIARRNEARFIVTLAPPDRSSGLLTIVARMPHSSQTLQGVVPLDAAGDDDIEQLLDRLEIAPCRGCGRLAFVNRGLGRLGQMCQLCRPETALLTRYDLRRIGEGRPYRVDIHYVGDGRETESFYTCYRPSDGALQAMARSLGHEGVSMVTVTSL